MIRIAVVEDSADLRDELVFQLQRLGHAVVGLADGVELDAHLCGSAVDVLVLDLGLPGEDGLSIAQRLHVTHPGLAIAALTARGRIEDRVMGLESGIDIYLVKPTDMRELAAVCESLYRRMHRLTVPARPSVGWQLDLQSFELVGPAGQAIVLTPTELKILRVLAEAAPEPASRSALAAAIGHPELDFDYRRLEATLSRLRRKIELQSGDAGALRSARNVGYVFAAPIRLWPAG